MKTILTLATVALLGSTSLVAAQETTAPSAFSLQEVQNNNGVIELGTVTAEADGVIEIYEIDDDARANPIGSQVVTAGANTDVKVTLTQVPLSDIVAVIRVGDAIVAEAEIDLDRSDELDAEGGDGGGDDGDDSDEGGDGEDANGGAADDEGEGEGGSNG